MSQCWCRGYIIMMVCDGGKEGQKKEESVNDSNAPNLLNRLYDMVPKAGLECAWH